MPAAVAIPAIISAASVGAQVYATKKQGDAQKAANNQLNQQLGQGQGYLTDVQGQLGNQYGNLAGIYGANGGVGAQTSNGTNYQQQFDQLFPGSSLTPQQLASQEQQLKNMGIRLLGPNAAGQRTKIELPDGRIVDVIQGAGAGKNIKQWGIEGGGGNSNSGMMSSFGGNGAVGQNLADYGNIMSRFQNFADTGGFSEGDKANIRSRAVSPIRSIYSSARQGLDRQRSLQGGYSPGYATALGRFSREQGQLSSDAATNAEAAIAEMTQRGKLAGMGGMAGIYGATPGLSSMFGNQMLTASGQQIQAAGLQGQLGLGYTNARNNIPQAPPFDFNKAAGTIGGAIYPWLNKGGQTTTPWGV